MSVLPDSRYFWRELLPRFIVLSLPVLWLLSRLSFGAFSVHGVIAALCASLIFNAGCALTHDWGRR